LVIGVLVIGYWLLVIGYWLLVYWLLVIGVLGVFCRMKRKQGAKVRFTACFNRINQYLLSITFHLDQVHG